MRRKSRGINKFLQVQGSKFSSFSGSGIKLLGKNMGSVTKKYTSLRPCYIDKFMLVFVPRKEGQTTSRPFYFNINRLISDLIFLRRCIKFNPPIRVRLALIGGDGYNTDPQSMDYPNGLP